MNAIQQRCRPKHQVLVLKCYPRTTKGAVDVKPNSSELSYLLYYATSRRTKIQKVGSFLERKTASDVWRQRIGNVQVTLQILEALIEKNPKDLTLFAPNVIKIFDLILRSNDLTMIESSIPTFEAFCSSHDASTLLADQFYLAQFEAVVGHYASLASTRFSPGKTVLTKPVAMRWRNTGLESIRAVASSESLSSIAGRKYDLMVPMILENLWTDDNQEALDILFRRAETDKVDSDRLPKRRTSIATVRTADTAGDTNPIALSGTAMDVDKLAEEDIGVLAMLCLKQIFITPSRSLIHYATIALLKFVKDRIDQGEDVVRISPNARQEHGWAVQICSILLRWAPVQERYIILITLMDALARTPLSDETLNYHIALTTMIASLLRSDASLIGLSVMDVLLGFIQHLKKLVQMPGDPAAAVAAAAMNGPRPGQPDPRSPTTLADFETVATAASKRKELLARLQLCIGDLATHIYYTDQISDMVATVLFRMRPPRTPAASAEPSTPTTAVEEKAENGAAGSSPQKQQPQQHAADSLFSLTVAKIAALKSIKAILLVANPKAKSSGNHTLSRNRVPIQVWEGTQWLLRDADGQVRKAYVDAVLTWLDRETSSRDQRARDECTIASSAPTMSGFGSRPLTRNGPPPLPAGASALAKRAVSSASNRIDNGTASGGGSKQPSGRRSKVHFLSMLHLAIYDNALQFVDYETDIVLLHVLLYKLVEDLGVNAVRYGLPMIFQLQEAIQEVDTPQAKVRLGSLVHGYFWTLVDKFRFESSIVGRAIRNEISRRRSKHFWVEGVHVPPPLLELVGTPGMLRPQPRMPLHEIESEALLPFDDRQAMVESLCAGYHESVVLSPPQSPVLSPSRGVSSGGGGGGGGGNGSFSSSFNFGTGGLSAGNGSAGGVAAGGASGLEEVPAIFKDQMMADWSRDCVIQSVQQHAGSKSASLSGSRTGTMGTNTNTMTVARGRLVTNTSSGLANGYLYFNGSGLSPSASQQNLRAASQRTGTAHGNGTTANDNLAAPVAAKLRKSSVRSGLSPSPKGSTSSRGGGHNGGGGFVTSVDQLKMALTGAVVHADVFGGGERQGADGQLNGDDASSDSIASCDMSVSDLSFNPAVAGPVAFPSTGSPAAAVSGASGGSGIPPMLPQDSEMLASASNRTSGGVSRKSSVAGDILERLGEVGDDVVSGEEHTLGANGSVPPVPPLPSPLLREHQFQQAQQANAQAVGSNAGLPAVKIASPMSRPASSSARLSGMHGARRDVRSRGGDSILGDEQASQGLGLESLLKGIDSRAGEASLGNLTRPPY